MPSPKYLQISPFIFKQTSNHPFVEFDDTTFKRGTKDNCKGHMIVQAKFYINLRVIFIHEGPSIICNKY
jgi:hypothetical protein